MARKSKGRELILKDTDQAPLGEILADSYMSYALSTMTRGIPLVNDGIKPSQRRIIYVLLNYEKRLTKSARIVGDTLGMYHPHGDASVYAAMVSLAQDFKRNYPLVIGQGNWGSIDGDKAADMRYTECRISEYCKDVYFGTGWEQVDWNRNYDDTLSEPASFAPTIPAILINGTTGIVAGFANNIPPHNLREVCDATLAYLDNAEPIEVLKCIKGPDFPTGGIVYVPKGYVIEASKTGTGKYTICPKYNIRPVSGGKFQIEFTELPYGVSKESIIDKYRDAYNNDRDEIIRRISVDGILDLSDTSISLTFTTKRGVTEAETQEIVDRMQDLKIITNTQNYSGNIVEYDTNNKAIIPVRYGTYQMIDAWYRYRRAVLDRFFTIKIDDLNNKIQMNKYLQIFINKYKTLAYAILDLPYNDCARLFARAGIPEEGFEYILSRNFKQVQNKGDKILKEGEDLASELKYYIAQKKNIKRFIIKEVTDIRVKYGRPRRTQIITGVRKSTAKVIKAK